MTWQRIFSMPHSNTANRPTGPAPMIATSVLWVAEVMALRMKSRRSGPVKCGAGRAGARGRWRSTFRCRPRPRRLQPSEHSQQTNSIARPSISSDVAILPDEAATVALARRIAAVARSRRRDRAGGRPRRRQDPLRPRLHRRPDRRGARKCRAPPSPWCRPMTAPQRHASGISISTAWRAPTRPASSASRRRWPTASR